MFEQGDKPMTSILDTTDWRRLGPIVLIGHRGAGKSTLGRRVADRLDRPFFDLDEEIAARSGRAVAELVDDAPRKFRQMERRVLSDLCDNETPPVVACGAGADPIPDCAFAVWLDREDWRDEVAASNRPRIRPESTLTEEWDWMEQTRRPRWRRRADLRLAIPRGRTVETSTDQLEALLIWATGAAHSPLAERTWLVATDSDELERALIDRRRFGLAGIELRSDFFPDGLPDVGDQPCLASLRHDHAGWLDTAAGARVWDIDIAHVDAVVADPPENAPEQLVVSAHPDDVDSSHLDALSEAGRRLATAVDIAPKAVALKYVPAVRDFEELAIFLDQIPRWRALDQTTTVLPAGRRFRWLRPILAPKNGANYLAVGLRTDDSPSPSPIHLRDYLPHVGPSQLQHFDGLVGDPVDKSRGTFFHRRRSIADGEPQRSYLKIPVERSELDTALPVLARLPIRGLSVTSPLKIEAAESEFVDNPDDLPALNTLVRTIDGSTTWRGTDTDAVGMDRTLEHLESQDIGPGTCVVFGRGGASHAVVRALEDRNWNIVDHISARRGWRPAHAEQLGPVDLIVNAAGPPTRRTEHTPTSRAWFDLHYSDVDPPPDDTCHLQGDLFFEAQADAQRQFWSSSTLTDSPPANIERI